MKIKRFVAQDIRKAIRRVREELGADAVILSNREIDGGVELVAAVDYDESLFGDISVPGASGERDRGERAKPEPAPRAHGIGVEPQPRAVEDTRARPEPRPSATVKPNSNVIEWAQDPTLVAMRRELQSLRGLVENQLSGLAWGDIGRRQPLRAKLLQHLLDLGISPSQCRALADAAPQTQDFDTLWRHTLGVLAAQVPVTDDDILTDGGVVALVGPTGVGKTTTIAKLAARYVLRGGNRSVALVTTDCFRVGAHEQLKTYGRILDVPVRIANDGNELRSVLASLQDKHLVLIDTAGMSQRDVRLSEQFAMLQDGSPSVKGYLVLSATNQRASLDEAVRAFDAVHLTGCVITKVDEATNLGAVISAVIQHRLPVAYIGDGQRVPEDLRPARAHSLVSRACALAEQTEEGLHDELLALALGERKANAHG